MQFQIISDIHLEYYNRMPEIRNLFLISAPNLILAGDICYYKHPNFEAFFKEVSRLYRHVFFIPGNHEYYTKSDIPDESFEIIDYLMRDKLKKYKNIFFIQQSYKELENVIIAGTTLWFKTHKT